ncbi:hypothetical protein LINPERHAP1_LOCUS13894, partial [Linum perenne]
KRRRSGGLLFAKPDYKKAYVTLRTPLSLSPDLFSLKVIKREKERMNEQQRFDVVEDGGGKKHWLEGKSEEKDRNGSCGCGYKGRRDDAAVEKTAMYGFRVGGFNSIQRLVSSFKSTTIYIRKRKAGKQAAIRRSLF